jgi:hypothetical protein
MCRHMPDRTELSIIPGEIEESIVIIPNWTVGTSCSVGYPDERMDCITLASRFWQMGDIHADLFGQELDYTRA